MTEKSCTKCGVIKPLSAFHKDPTYTHGKAGRCKVCAGEASRVWRESNRERSSLLNWASHLFTSYNLTIERYMELLTAQGGVCAICKRAPSPSKWNGHFAVDHDHSCCPGVTSCGKCLRGLLCDSCNRALGFMRESTSTLYRAIDYLNAYAV